MTQMKNSQHHWSGETGLLSNEMFSKHLKDAVSPIFYAAGPPEIVKGLRSLLNEREVDDNDIRTVLNRMLRGLCEIARTVLTFD